LFFLPIHLRQIVRKTLLEVLISPVKNLHTTLLQYRIDTIYKVRFNGQIIYLTKFLNDRYDNIFRGIYIDNVANVNIPYLYNKAEVRPKTYLYNKWDGSIAYSAGEFSVYGTNVYIALGSTTNDQPDISPADWAVYKDRFFLKNKIEYQTQYDFIVMVPVPVTFNVNEMKAFINYYKLAGKRYTIQTY